MKESATTNNKQSSQSRTRRRHNTPIPSQIFYSTVQANFFKAYGNQAQFISRVTQIMNSLQRRKINKAVQEIKSTNKYFRKYLNQRRIINLKVDDIIWFQDICDKLQMFQQQEMQQQQLRQQQRLYNTLSTVAEEEQSLLGQKSQPQQQQQSINHNFSNTFDIGSGFVNSHRRIDKRMTTTATVSHNQTPKQIDNNNIQQHQKVTEHFTNNKSKTHKTNNNHHHHNQKRKINKQQSIKPYHLSTSINMNLNNLLLSGMSCENGNKSTTTTFQKSQQACAFSLSTFSSLNNKNKHINFVKLFAQRQMIKKGFMTFLEKIECIKKEEFITQTKYLEGTIERECKKLKQYGYEFLQSKQQKIMKNVIEQLERQQIETGLYNMIMSNVREETLAMQSVKRSFDMNVRLNTRAGKVPGQQQQQHQQHQQQQKTKGQNHLRY